MPRPAPPPPDPATRTRHRARAATMTAGACKRCCQDWSLPRFLRSHPPRTGCHACATILDTRPRRLHDQRGSLCHHLPHPCSRDRVVAVAELPPALRPAFRFAYFNVVQSDCFNAAFGGDAPLVVAAPTGAGKTGVLELCLARRLLAPARGALPAKALYLAPSRALVQERLADWRSRFGPLGITADELTGDAGADGVAAARLVCATPEKLDAVTRGRGPRGAAAFVGDVGIVLIDEVHTLSDPGRGATLEAVVARLRTIGAAPRMAGTPLATARYVAVSASLPNAADVGAWLGPGADVRAYGDEVRPVPLDVVVRGYPPTQTDFLFERRLDEHLPTILTEFGDGRPALVFCASRKGAESTARSLATPTASRRGAAGPAAVAALDAAAALVSDRSLADTLRAGVGIHHAGLDAGDRGAVEALFAARALPVLCATSTLATGVNLPAYLVIVKGTRRWAAEPGAPSGFVDYSSADILQMLGRAGRPQFDSRGVGVVMTVRGSPAARTLGGGAPARLVSRLDNSLDDALNAEIVLRTVTDVEGAAAWFKRTFLWATIAADPGAAGFPPGALPDATERLAVQRHIATALQKLMTAGLARAEPGGTALTPLPPGAAAARHYVRLATVASLRRAPRHASVSDLLDAVCRADELVDVPLRRGERKPLATLNRAAAAAGLPAIGGGTSKARIATPADKLFVLLVDACGPSPGVGLDFSLRREADAALRVGDRVAACAAAVFQDDGALAATANAFKLGRALRTKAWDDTDAEVRQLRGVATALGARLAAAGLGSLALLRAADAHRIELATGRPYPFGAELLADAASLSPPPVTLRIVSGGWRAGGRLDATVTLTRTAPPPRPPCRPPRVRHPHRGHTRG